MKNHASKRSRGVLVASFIEGLDDQRIEDEVIFIVNNLSLSNNLIFLLQDKENPDKKILTYNIEKSNNRNYNPRLFTMRVHRKKQTNTLYTINALNAAIAAEHDGQTGSHLKLTWENYTDCLLLTSGKNLQCHPIEVVKIFKIEDPPEEN